MASAASLSSVARDPAVPPRSSLAHVGKQLAPASSSRQLSPSVAFLVSRPGTAATSSSVA
ncbi:hypothetical protein E2562_023291 [Oryza meyeriana var. granulata]|uniref:Uncharacterized protein n=1 Tax=Oryza meyeriana var. granulata TaxID=110450 RepID=A0A6G1DM57_9ORYZ|nr:hypothetical protein E2562_023291 [Oryza meyeriana var. granulata]